LRRVASECALFDRDTQHSMRRPFAGPATSRNNQMPASVPF
jgi:hypothetical protein